MAEEKKSIDVKFITSLALAVNDVEDNVQHVQVTIVQEIESRKFRCYFDVVDPSKVKLSQE